MKKLVAKIFPLAMCAVMVLGSIGFAGCGSEPDLRIYNCFDYIDETLIDKFEQEYEERTGKSITVEYDTFDTPEDCYNQLKIYPDHYDLVCPSDYMIEKMAKEDMLEEIEMSADGAYRTYVSPFIDNTFNSITWGDKSIADYAAGYMWGTLGLVYKASTVSADDMKSWTSLWDSKYQGKFTIKDSVRDTYFIGLAKYYNEDLLGYKATYESSGDLNAYQASLKAALNDTSEATVNAVKTLLLDLRSKSYGMEVDSGKDDIINGRTEIYFAWSGDAVYAMDESDALEKPVTLNYSVPEEGSNIWFDGWCVPKGAKNKDLALEFIDFISTPENVITNMEYIGYTSCIAGDEIFDWVTENFSTEEGDEVDLSYFFATNGSSETYTVINNIHGRQFETLYPSEDIIKRCVVMNYFPDEANDRITDMWIEVTA